LGHGHVARVKEQMNQNLLPLLSDLQDSSFVHLSQNQAQYAYIKSLVAVNWIHEEFGWFGVRNVMEELGTGASTEIALEEALNLKLAEFERKLTKFILAKAEGEI